MKYEFNFEIGDYVYCVFRNRIEEGIADHIFIDDLGDYVYDKYNCVIGCAVTAFKNKEDAQKYWLENFSQDLDTNTDIDSIIKIEKYSYDKPVHFNFAGHKNIPVTIPYESDNPDLDTMRQILKYIKEHRVRED